MALMVASCTTAPRIYEIENGEVFGCSAVVVHSCGLMMYGCDGIDIFCARNVKATDDESLQDCGNCDGQEGFTRDGDDST
jgi:hypothetical protein